MTLTDVAVRTANARETSYRMSDGNGLYLLIKPSGSKVWRYDYRHLDRRLTLAVGAYPKVSLKVAREIVAKARNDVALGINPSQQKQEVREAAKAEASNTFATLSEEYLADMADKKRSESTINRTKWILNTELLPVLGKMEMRDIRPSAILPIIKGIEASGRLETAHRTRTLVGSIFRMAILTDRADSDPSRVLHGVIAAREVENMPSITDPVRYGSMLRAVEAYEGSPIIKDALRMLSLTFVRPGELRMARWSEIDMLDEVWNIPAKHTKMKRDHAVPITLEIRKVLVSRGWKPKKKGLIFPSPSDSTKVMSDNTLNKALSSMGYKRIMTAHGFRASASSILNERGYRYDVIEAQLGHIEKNVVRRAYNRTDYWDERVSMMEDWSQMVISFREGA